MTEYKALVVDFNNNTILYTQIRVYILVDRLKGPKGASL